MEVIIAALEMGFEVWGGTEKFSLSQSPRVNHLILVGSDFQIYASTPFTDLVDTVVFNWENTNPGALSCRGLAAS